MVQQASGGKLTWQQSANTWDCTIHKFGQQCGILTGSYVKPQEGTSKRTAAGNTSLQRVWYDVVTDLIKAVRERAMKVLNDNTALVDLLMPDLIINTDEECVQATGKNDKCAASKRQKKHNSQIKSSRCQQIILFTISFVFPTELFELAAKLGC